MAYNCKYISFYDYNMIKNYVQGKENATIMGKDIDINKIYIKLQRQNNLYIDKILFRQIDRKEKRLLMANEEYRGLYGGKRCFIVGNGPSVNKVDFSKLKNELVITVNEMFRHEKFDSLGSKFHFIADPAYLKLSRGNRIEAEIIEKIGQLLHSNTILFWPMGGANAIERYKWPEEMNIRYFASKLYFYDNYKEEIDFTKYIPGFQAVIQWCIAFAIYMGCSEIYLLGCDATNIVTDVSMFVKKDTEFTYAYELSHETAETLREKRVKRGLEYTLYGYWRIVHLFSELYRYCRRNKVKLYNCSDESILEGIPKRRIDDIL